jgi:Xaa-Pro aminopeptidase
LWNIGLDYDHGTGHSVGHDLPIHEYPHRFAKKPNLHGLEAARPARLLSFFQPEPVDLEMARLEALSYGTSFCRRQAPICWRIRGQLPNA